MQFNAPRAYAAASHICAAKSVSDSGLLLANCSFSPPYREAVAQRERYRCLTA